MWTYSNVLSRGMLTNRRLEFKENYGYGIDIYWYHIIILSIGIFWYFSVMEPLWPISNSVVKRYSGENTKREAFWKNNSMPRLCIYNFFYFIFLISRYLLSCLILKRVGRIELPSLAWKAKVLPLNYTRTLFLYT